MIRALHIGNFKAFGHTQRVPIKPITLIFGPNSAGKSSLIHSLALAHQAERTDDLDVVRTDIGGRAIDLGGFRQYVHCRQVSNRVTWGIDLDISEAPLTLQSILGSSQEVSLKLTFGMELDDQDRPKHGATPQVISYEFGADDQELVRMSIRPSGTLAVDWITAEHPIIRAIVEACVDEWTTTSEITEEDLEAVESVITELIPKLRVEPGGLFPERMFNEETTATGAQQSMLFPVSKRNRIENLKDALRFFLPRSMETLVSGVSQMAREMLKRLEYLGPLRSYPGRHMAFVDQDQDDANWYSGGAYAWDVVRRNTEVRTAVNEWLGSADRLQTPYELRVRKLVTPDAQDVYAALWDGLDDILATLGPSMVDDDLLDEEAMNKLGIAQEDYSDPDNEAAGPLAAWDPDRYVEILRQRVASEAVEGPNELVLFDKRTSTVVSHRDVGIGISQVLPVLVGAYGSSKRVLTIEQPEIHLHPALQAELGDVFIEAALGERKNTFLLETHSEHLLLRLMRRMRETADEQLDDDTFRLTPDDVMVLYVEPDGSRSIVREMPLNERGELIKAWPGGFFEEGLREVF